jgi:hypothetical protein
MCPVICASFGANGLPSMEPVAAGTGCAAAAGADAESGADPLGAEDAEAAADVEGDVEEEEEEEEEDAPPLDSPAPFDSSEAVSFDSVSAGLAAPPQATRARSEQASMTRMG